jgi:Ferritin-like
MKGAKIFPRNLTARAAYQIAGNPDISRPEDSVANCFPGLDLDARNFDRRFFPGLVFEYVSDDGDRAGALLLYVDARGDTDLQPDYIYELQEDDRDRVERLRAQLFEQLIGPLSSRLGNGSWYLDWIEQSRTRVAMSQIQPDGSTQPLDGIVVWRLIRGLEPGPMTIGLVRRDLPDNVQLEGWRRFFTGPRTGVLSRAYQPGELLMSLCSPWQHDFRDCACHYWSSNRPDVVHGVIDHGAPVSTPELANIRLDWMRADRSQAAAALSTMGANRPFQMDHFQINRTWQDLNVVLNNREIDSVHLPGAPEEATPYASPEDLYLDIRDRLAGIEMTLALEYIYARFSLVTEPNPAWPNIVDHAEFVRHYLLLIAVSEMQHLRWANELLWSLVEARQMLPPYAPVLTPSREVPLGVGSTRPRALRWLEPKVLDEFIAAEQPSGTINGAYARVVATLQRPEYPPHLNELAGRIVNEGVQHFERFHEIKTVLRIYEGVTPIPYLRPITKGSTIQAASAVAAFDAIVNNLTVAYTRLSVGHFGQAAQSLADARNAMNRLVEEGERLAADGVGIPFWP